MKAADARAMTLDQLDDEVLKLKKEQFNLRFQKATGQLENVARVTALWPCRLAGSVAAPAEVAMSAWTPRRSPASSRRRLQSAMAGRSSSRGAPRRAVLSRRAGWRTRQGTRDVWLQRLLRVDLHCEVARLIVRQILV